MTAGKQITGPALLLSALLGSALLGCAPDRPNDATHRRASNRDCIDCHLGDEGPDPPSNHFDDDGDLKSSRDDCKSCHDLE